MTDKDITKLKDMGGNFDELRYLCRKDRKNRKKTNWNYMSTKEVQTGQLNRFLNDNAGITEKVFESVRKWLIDNN